MPTCLLNVVKILATGAPVAMSSTALIRIKWESFNWVSSDSRQVLLSVCYKMGKSRATDPSSLAHSLFNTIQSLSLSFTSFSRQTHRVLQTAFIHMVFPTPSCPCSPFMNPLLTSQPPPALDGPCFCTLCYPPCSTLYTGGLAGGGFSVYSHVLHWATDNNIPVSGIQRDAVVSVEPCTVCNPPFPTSQWYPLTWLTEVHSADRRDPLGLETPVPFTSPP